MRRCLLLFVCLGCVWSAVCTAAVQNASLYGSVYNVDGKPLAGVTIVLENPDLGVKRATISGTDGSYVIADISPARGYRVSAIQEGRPVDVRADIEIHVGDERVVLPPLRKHLDAAAETVKTDDSIHTDAVNPASSTIITREQLVALPLYNRNFLALGLLTPNAHDIPGGSPLEGATFVIAGARPTSNNFLLDGTDSVASSSNQAIPYQVNDSIAEFRVTSAAAGAEYGRNIGGIVNVITRRATNQFHGGAFGFFGNDALNADSPLSVYNGSTFHQAAAYAGSTSPNAPDFTQTGSGWYPQTYNDYVAGAAALGFCTIPSALGACNPSADNPYFDPAPVLAANDSRTVPMDSRQFGANAGGALVKDRVFLFGSYEGTRINNPNPVFERVPTAFDISSNPAAQYFTSSSPGYADYQFAQQVLSLYPHGNVIGVPGVLEFYRGQAPNYTNADNYLLRTDVASSKKSNLTLRYNVQKLDQLHDASLPAAAGYAGNGAVRSALNQNIGLSVVRSYGAKVSTETHFGLSRFRLDETAQDSGTVLNAALGLPGSELPTFLLSGIDSQYSGRTPTAYGAQESWVDSYWNRFAFMSPTLNGLFPYARIGAPLTAPSQRHDTTLSFNQGITIQRGKHLLKAGYEYRRLFNLFENGSFGRGLVFSGNMGEFTSDSESDDLNLQGYFGGFAHPSFDYALRQPSAYAANLSSGATSAFAQDVWRAFPRLTLTAGVRYEYFSTPSERNNNLWNFDSTANGLVQAGASQVVSPDGLPCSASRSVTFVPQLFQGNPFAQPWSCSAKGSGSTMAGHLKNFAPRLGVAWDLRGDGRTVLHLGSGWYYDQLPTSDFAQLMYNRPTPLSNSAPELIYGQDSFYAGAPYNRNFQFSQGNTTLNTSGSEYSAVDQAASSPMAMSAIDHAHSSTPYSLQANVSVEQRLGAHAAVELGYIGTFASDLPIVVNSNFNREWGTNEFLGPVFTMTNQGHSTYNSLLARVQSMDWRGLRVQGSYVYSRSMDNASDSVFPVLPFTAEILQFGPLYFGLGSPVNFFGSGLSGSLTPSGSKGSPLSSASLNAGLTTSGNGNVYVTPYTVPQDPNRFLKDEWGASDFDSRHALMADFAWQVPSLHRAHIPLLLDDWTLSGILNARSGQPFTIFSGPIDGEMTQRVNVSGPVRMTGNPNGYIDSSNLLPAAYACKGLFQFDASGNFVGPCTGNSRRNAFPGPAFVSFDSAVQKSFAMAESRSISVRAEFFNLFNRANYYNPISTISSDGVSINPDFGHILSAHAPRQIQFAARFTW